MRVGLVGFSGPTGIGTNCRRFWKNLPFEKWMVPQHSLFGFGEIKDKRAYKLSKNDFRTVYQFLDTLDVVVSYERTWPDNLFQLAKEKNIKTILICNAEWIKPNDASVALTDKLIIRTKHGYNYLQSLGLGFKTYYVPCPIDLDELKFERRSIANKVVFVNGLGGMNRRKGGPIITEALKIRPTLPIKVYSIKGNRYSKTVFEMYKDVDLAVQPSLYEGTGLSILEPMACGIPCLTTDHSPMNEYIYGAFGNDADKFLFKNPTFKNVYSGAVDWQAAISDPNEIVRKLDFLINTNISMYSQMARDYIVKNHGQTAFENLWNTIIS